MRHQRQGTPPVSSPSVASPSVASPSAFRERGATAVEYAGAIVVAAVVVAAVSLGISGTGFGAKVACSVENIVTAAGADCAQAASAGESGESGEQPGESEADTGDRRDQQRDARDSRRDDARGGGEDDGDGGGSGGEGGTSGGTASSHGLGDPVAGTTPPAIPDPPEWTPPDEGAGTHGSESAGVGDHATKFAAEAAANGLAWTWPDASRNLLHFLGNSGDPLEQDVDAMLAASQNFSTEVDQQRDRVIASAIEQAESMGSTGPVTFPVNTPWRGVYISDNDNWFYALGGISYNQTGYVTLTPPVEQGGSWTYVWSTEVNIRDRYNWDGTKSTDIGPINISDEQLAELHRKGLAREYTAVGSSSSQHHTGEAP